MTPGKAPSEDPCLGPRSREARALLIAPTGKDAALVIGLLGKAGICSQVIRPEDLGREIEAGAGALIMTEETAASAESNPLAAALAAQPAWSDLPIVLLMVGGADSKAAARVMELFGNVILLERPVRVNTLVSAVRTALRARRKQYQIRDHVADRERMNQDLERKVSERTAELTASNKELESFCYTIAHDLRTPLRGINGFAHLLRRSLDKKAYELNEEEKDYLFRIGAASSRMGRLIDDLLNFARMVRGDLRQEDVDLSALAATTVQELRKGAPNRRVRVKITPGITARGDPGLLSLLLQNLLENAWKFTGRTPRAAVEFGLSGKKGGAACFVRDNGVGFDMAYGGKLFGVFQRLHAEEEFPGNGIGLATVRRIIERHNGRVWAESTLGRGATFYFTLPGLAMEARKNAPRGRAVRRHSSRRHFSRRRSPLGV